MTRRELAALSVLAMGFGVELAAAVQPVGVPHPGQGPRHQSLPVLGAVSSSNLNLTSATLSAEVSTSGIGAPSITGRGFLYAETAISSDPNFLQMLGIPPSVPGVTEVAVSGGAGLMSIVVNDLRSGTSYSFVAYGTNINGSTKSQVGTFTTLTSLPPTIASPTSVEITGSTATLGGNVTSDGGAPITERGIVHSLTAINGGPSIGGPGVSKSTVSGTTGLFTSGVTGLRPASGYSFKAFATNANGTSYTSVATFTTLPTVPDAPGIGVATAGDATVFVTFTAPTSDGGSPITGFTATCGGKSASGLAPLIVVPGLTNGVAVTCTVLATNAIGNGPSSTASNSVTPAFAGTAIPRLVNISTRGLVETGDNIMIGGFIIGGSVPKKVVITGRGPFLADFNVPGTMADPAIRLFAGAVEIGSNDNWLSAANATEVAASGFAPSKAAEAAILTTVNPGVPYTVHLTGAANSAGVAIVEVFEVDKPEVPLLNLSSRGRVQTGDNVMIAGFIIQGHGPQEVLITARGPSLGQVPFNVPGVLLDPVLELYQGATPIDFNDNWGESTRVTAIQATGNAPTSALEAAILRTLQPGPYTAIVRGKNGGIGVGLVEVYAK